MPVSYEISFETFVQNLGTSTAFAAADANDKCQMLNPKCKKKFLLGNVKKQILLGKCFEFVLWGKPYEWCLLLAV